MTDGNGTTGMRRDMYLLLSLLYVREPDAALLAALRGMAFPPDCPFPELAAGYAAMRDYLDAADDNAVEELAADYAGTFLAAGVAQGMAAFPYASVYTSKRRLVGQEPCARVSAVYAKKGLVLSPAYPKMPDDHIGAELALMAHLCGEELDGTTDGQRSREEQRAFLEEHLLPWAFPFCRDVEAYAKTGFYRALARITRGFLQGERDLLAPGPQQG